MGGGREREREGGRVEKEKGEMWEGAETRREEKTLMIKR